jgi:CubicO group peptidase (beta-lactamase class C family)
MGLFGGIIIDKKPEVDMRQLNSEILKAALTVVRNENNIVPIARLSNRKIACLEIGAKPNDDFLTFTDKYASVDHFTIGISSSVREYSTLWAHLANYDLIVEAVYGPEFANLDSSQTVNFSVFQHWLNTSNRCVTAWFGEPVLFQSVGSLHEAPCLVAAWEPVFSTKHIPQVIFGGMDAIGVLPFSLKEKLPEVHGVILQSIGRFAYEEPEIAGMSSTILSKIDSLVAAALSAGAMPGCQVFIAKDGHAVYEKSFGYHTYDSLRLVKDTDLYDLASLTKVSAALPALMLLYDQGKFSLDATLSTYLPYFKNSNKADLTFRELLTHQAGLTSWIPFWKNEMKKNGTFRKRAISSRESKKYDYAIANGLYLKSDFRKHIYRQIKSSPIGEKKYIYSDLSFYLYPEIVEKLSGQKYEDFLVDNFYKPLGAGTMTYNPLANYPIDRIVPTEYDSLFRKGQIHGHVHDEGAAMMHGVSGHAGLFSDANDLAKLWQMYCNYGEYGGRRFLSDTSMHEFTRCQFPENNNRRALGFDRPMPIPRPDGNTAVSVSQASFGHTGFTGNFVWVDPEINLVYIFLSNRVYPTRNNTKLYDLNIRTNIQEVIYEAIKNGNGQ